MPRQNQVREIPEEDHLARRIAYERQVRDWSPAGLAQRMTEAGCAIQTSAIYKIEQGEPRRRITVAELVALSKVFGVTMDDLLIPPEFAKERRIQRAYKRWVGAVRDVISARDRAVEALDQLRTVAPDQEAVDILLRTSEAEFNAGAEEWHWLGAQLARELFASTHDTPTRITVGHTRKGQGHGEPRKKG